MIDCENEVYTRIATELRASFPKVNIASEYVNAPSSFPHVSITMSDNYVNAEHQTSSLTEDVATVMFEVNVYSNATSGKKTECKKIMALIDTLFYRMNFRRLALTPVPNLEDATIYRLTGRYRASTDGTHFYRG